MLFLFAAVQDSRNRVQDVLTSELPLLVSSTESSSNQGNTLQLMDTNTSGDASSDKAVPKMHQIRWSAKFDQFNNALCTEERDLVRTYTLPSSQNDYIQGFEARGGV